MCTLWCVHLNSLTDSGCVWMTGPAEALDSFTLSLTSTSHTDIQLSQHCYLVKLLIISHCQLNVPGSDSAFLVVSRCISCQLQDLSFNKERKKYLNRTDDTPDGLIAIISRMMHMSTEELYLPGTQ